MRIMKKELDSIQVAVELKYEEDKHAATLIFNYIPKTKKISLTRYGIEELDVAEAQDMFKVLIDLCPKLENAINTALHGVTKF